VLEGLDRNKSQVITWAIFFCSGAAGLIYEILWMKQLSLLFGGTAESVAVTTAAFFAGIGCGSWFWGKRSKSNSAPLKTYALLEFGVVGAALAYFVVFEVYLQAYSTLFGWFADSAVVFTGVKLLLAILLICPATFLMGGTLPLMGQHLLRGERDPAVSVGLLYGINTLGAVAGAVSAGFFLPRIVGLQNAYLVALSLTTLVGMAAWALAGRTLTPSDEPKGRMPGFEGHVLSLHLIRSLAFASGCLSLGLQVLWTRMFVQVLQNSTYTYAAILSIFLLALAIGALAAWALARRFPAKRTTMIALHCLAGFLCLASPFVFDGWPYGMTYLGDGAVLTSYLIHVLEATFVIIGIPVSCMGMILPYLYRYDVKLQDAPGELLGQVNGYNIFGAIVGSLLAAFALLPLLGLWTSITIMAIGYMLIGILLAEEVRLRMATIAILVVAITLMNPTRLPVVRVDDATERVLQVWEGPGGSVAVVERDNGLQLKLNGWYSLGGTDALGVQALQTHLPMSLHPQAGRLFYLGLGSGITAGTALRYPVRQVLVTELSREVMHASRGYFSEFTGGLFDDARARVIHADGRTYLRGTRDSFDLIIADLFVPWRAGVGSLYTREHFAAARERLNQGGLFVQWVALYQMTERELGIIAATMAAVFPQVTLWRGDFNARRPILALVGHLEVAPLHPAATIIESSRADLARYTADGDAEVPLITYYLGSLSDTTTFIQDLPVSTEDRPWIDFLAPESHRAERAGAVTWLTLGPMIHFMRQLRRYGASGDPYLARLEPALHKAVEAGLQFHLASVALAQDDEAGRKQALAAGRALLVPSRE